MLKTRQNARQARLSLDRSLDDSRWPRIPARGWVRAIREALDMSCTDLGMRLGISRQAVSQLERSEIDGTIQLETLRRAAEAMDCTLVYAIVPNGSLEEIVDRRAFEVASVTADRVAHTMRLEDQGVDPSDLVRELANEAKSSRSLWRSVSGSKP